MTLFLKTHQVFGLSLNRFTYQHFDRWLDDVLTSRATTHLVTVYSEYLVRAELNPEFKRLLQGADVLCVDGVGPIWAASFLQKARGHNWFFRVWWFVITGASLIFYQPMTRRIFPIRLSGADLWLDVCRKCEERGLSVLLVARPYGPAHDFTCGLSSFEEVRDALQKLFPELKIYGHFSYDDPTIMIRKYQPAVIFCGLGMPRQDEWLVDVLSKSPNVRLGIGVGGSFDFLTGKQKRAPWFFQKLGIEWLWRLLKQPSRWRRIWTATIRLMRIAFQESKR